MARGEPLKKYLKTITSILLIVGLGYYLWDHWPKFTVAFDASWSQISGLFVCILATWVISSLQSLLFLRNMGIEARFWENLIVSMAMILGNYLPMRVGSIIKMRYFKKIHGLQYSGYLGLAGARALIVLFASSLLVALGLIYPGTGVLSLDWVLVSFLLAVTVVAVGSLVMPWHRLQASGHFFARKLSYFFEALSIVRSHPTLFWQISVLVLLQFATLALRLRLSFEAVNIELTSAVLLVLAPTITLISFLSLTPGNLGLREWAVGAIVVALGLDFSSGIFAATLDRAILLVATFVLGPGPLAYVWHRAAIR